MHQNLVLRWVRDESLYDVWQRLNDLDLGDAGADEITDNVSCPGTDSCKLGITSSMGLNKAINDRLLEMDIQDPLTRKIHIKNSGCPNGCSQHHIANIGFYGASMKIGDRHLPAYVCHIGGNYEGGDVVMGTRLKVRLPAKRVPDAIERWMRYYEADRNEGEEFNAFVERVGRRGVRGTRQGPVAARGLQPREHAVLRRLGAPRAVQGRSRRGRVRGLMAVPAPTVSARLTSKTAQRRRCSSTSSSASTRACTSRARSRRKRP